MAKGTAKTRSAERRLVTAAPKVSKALDELREALDDPFGPLSVPGAERIAARQVRDKVSEAARALLEGLTLLHSLNEGGEA